MYANKYYVKENLDWTVVEVFDFLFQDEAETTSQLLNDAQHHPSAALNAER